ncbi:hypothetical protein HYR99_17170 [Candidatus Poribacteria bacterium]|nr:hypothetical protein [Candidatus Poribacteria bacterium]
MGRTGAQALIEEGKEIGIEQGVLQARQEVLRELMQDKFGSIPQQIETRIQAIQDVDRLKMLIRNVIHASRIEEIVLE